MSANRLAVEIAYQQIGHDQADRCDPGPDRMRIVALGNAGGHKPRRRGSAHAAHNGHKDIRFYCIEQDCPLSVQERGFWVPLYILCEPKPHHPVAMIWVPVSTPERNRLGPRYSAM